MYEINLPSRRWEFFFRTVCACARSAVLDDPGVQDRRLRAGVTEDAVRHTASWEEARRTPVEAREAAEHAARAWCTLFDAWFDPAGGWGRRDFVFDDVYAVIFFVSVLESDDRLLFRGQACSDWKLAYGRSFLTEEQLRINDASGTEFMARVMRDPTVAAYYKNEPMPESHRQAILQHYGFKTFMIDFTTDPEVAAYFAEGDSDEHAAISKFPEGAIYAIPAVSIPEASRLVTLPPCFPRPRLQRGVFIDGEHIDLDSYEQAKYVFKHQDFPIRSGLGSLPWGSAPGMKEFYYPAADPIASLAPERGPQRGISDWRNMWLQDTYALCFHDRGHGRMWVNDHHLRLRCRDEPTLALDAFDVFLRTFTADKKTDEDRDAYPGIQLMCKCLARSLRDVIGGQAEGRPQLHARLARVLDAHPWVLGEIR